MGARQRAVLIQLDGDFVRTALASAGAVRVSGRRRMAIGLAPARRARTGYMNVEQWVIESVTAQ
jgi:hypothetical protein